MAFIVAHFLETDDISIISQSWLIDEHRCKWPPYENDILIKRALLTNKFPEADWKDCEIHVMAAYDTYARAKKKVISVTDVDSDSDSELPEAKRQRLQSILSNSSLVPSDTIIKEEILSQNSCETVETRDSSTTMSPQRAGSRTSSNNFENAIVISNPQNNLIPFQPDLAPLITSVTTASSQVSQPVSDNQSPRDNEERSQDEAFQERVCKLLETTLQEVRALSHEVQKMQNLYLTINADIPEVNPDFSLPIRNEAELEKMEALVSDEETKLKMIKLLSRLGGVTFKDTTYFVMRKLMNSKLSSKFSFHGKKGKRPFRSLNLCQIAISAIMLRIKDASVSDIEKRIGLYLANSGDRDGGRKFRKMKYLSNIAIDSVSQQIISS